MSNRIKHETPCVCKKNILKQIHEYLPFLKQLAAAKPSKRTVLLENAPACFFNFVSMCSGAILRNDLELSPKGYDTLKPYTNLLLYLNNKRHSLKRKKAAFLSKHGGFFPFIPILASILGPIFGKLISEHI